MTAAPGILKLAYCIVLLFAVFPLGLAGSSWVSLARGGLSGALPFVGIVPILALAIYRIYLVARVRGTLDSYPVGGFAKVLRWVGVLGISFGALVSVASVAAGPLMKALVSVRTESGAEFFVVGMYLSMLGGLGTLGLICFELSRLVAFEKHARKLQPS